MRRTRSRLRLAGWLTMLALAVLLTACGGGEETADEGGAAEEASETDDGATDGTSDDDASTDDGGDDPAMAEGVSLELAEGEPGEFIVDGEGNTLYLFTNDEQGASACYDGCAQNWPPLTSDGEVSVSDELDSELVGTTTRDDGAEQVTYNDWPLYHFAADEAPGDVNGQGSNDVWFVVGPDGEMIEG